MHCNGQLSLEYLLLLLAVLSIFAVMLPLLNSVYDLSLFGLDCVNAKRFSFSLQEAIEEASFQADGSLVSIEANPLTNWLLSSSGNSLAILVQGPGESKKSFEVIFPNQLHLDNASITSKTSFVLRKNAGQILLEYS